MNNDIILRPAEMPDVRNIHLLLHDYAIQGVLLDRSEEDIAFYLKNFTVAVDSSNTLLGCMAVRDFGGELLEVRSLAIRSDLRKSGIGRKLVAKAIARLDEELGNYRLFALTLQPGFFERLGFEVVEKELFPEKIWADCSHCPKRECCDEIAVIYCGKKL
ncbi:MAG: GNAT family N-acetyltransferase [Lentisphaeria bacterium]|nr:GNAT family N-acetyltransferase [Lentisphaerota bacterium]MBR7145867.1 GNAT family N-acetyltransferase [Lentisphaeria bacterium]